MQTLITSGIQISVETQFRPDLSNIVGSEFLFIYRIDIENTNGYPVQLISRDWYIFDSLHDARYVSGEGVVGEQPILKPGETYTYTSGCDLFSEIGMMKGFYTFKNLSTEVLFEVIIPTFKLEYKAKLN